MAGSEEQFRIPEPKLVLTKDDVQLILSKGRTPIGYLNKYHTALQEIESNEVAFFDQEIDLA